MSGGGRGGSHRHADHARTAPIRTIQTPGTAHSPAARFTGYRPCARETADWPGSTGIPKRETSRRARVSLWGHVIMSEVAEPVRTKRFSARIRLCDRIPQRGKISCGTIQRMSFRVTSRLKADPLSPFCPLAPRAVDSVMINVASLNLWPAASGSRPRPASQAGSKVHGLPQRSEIILIVATIPPLPSVEHRRHRGQR